MERMGGAIVNLTNEYLQCPFYASGTVGFGEEQRHPGAELRDLEMGNDFLNVGMYYAGKLEGVRKVGDYLVSEGFLRKECLH